MRSESWDPRTGSGTVEAVNADARKNKEQPELVAVCEERGIKLY